MTKIRKDTHGLFVKHGDYLFRPDWPVHPLYNAHRVKTEFFDGAEVWTKVRPFTPLLSVHRHGSTEAWFCHGVWVNALGQLVSSRLVYRPAGFAWETING